MDCPKCGVDTEILDYSEDYREGYGLSPEQIIQQWKCACPCCGFVGTYTKLFQLKCEEWDCIE